MSKSGSRNYFVLFVCASFKLLGGASGESAIEMAVKERDRELILDGREAISMAVGIRQKAREEIDQLIAELDGPEFYRYVGTGVLFL